MKSEELCVGPLSPLFFLLLVVDRQNLLLKTCSVVMQGRIHPNCSTHIIFVNEIGIRDYCCFFSFMGAFSDDDDDAFFASFFRRLRRFSGEP